MSLGTQVANLQTMATLTGLTRDIFVGDVVNNVRRKSICSMVYQDAKPGEYRLFGQKMKFAADLRYKTGAVATDGKLPDFVGIDSVQGELTPVRRYQRIALDNMIEKQATGEGAFEDLSDYIFRHFWDAWEGMEIRQSIGYASGLVAKIASRTSSTVVVLKDGYGNTGTNPLLHLSEGAIVAWYDVSESAIGGAGKITAINYATKAITISSAATWEPDPAVAANDLLFFATTTNITRDYFISERNLAPNGFGTVVDPLAALTTVHGIAESSYPRWRPFRQASTTLDHLEVTEHWVQLGAKRGFDVSPQTDIAITFPSVAAQLARSMMMFQQQAYTGSTLKGGYAMGGASGNSESDLPHAGLEIAGVPVYTDGHFYHDTLMTLCRNKLFRVNLGADADFWAGDGSMWARTANFDGKDAFAVDYLQFFSPDRGSHGALTGINAGGADAYAAAVPTW
jgi:hypothetical protein